MTVWPDGDERRRLLPVHHFNAPPAMTSAKSVSLLVLLLLALQAGHHQESKTLNPLQPRLIKNILRMR
jgi:hypothetical protein